MLLLELLVGLDSHQISEYLPFHVDFEVKNLEGPLSIWNVRRDPSLLLLFQELESRLFLDLLQLLCIVVFLD